MSGSSFYFRGLYAMTAPLLSAMLWLPVGGGFRLNEWGGFVRFGIGLGGRSVRSGSRAYMSGEYRLYKKRMPTGSIFCSRRHLLQGR